MVRTRSSSRSRAPSPDLSPVAPISRPPRRKANKGKVSFHPSTCSRASTGQTPVQIDQSLCDSVCAGVTYPRVSHVGATSGSGEGERPNTPAPQEVPQSRVDPNTVPSSINNNNHTINNNAIHSTPPTSQNSENSARTTDQPNIITGEGRSVHYPGPPITYVFTDHTQPHMNGVINFATYGAAHPHIYDNRNLQQIDGLNLASGDPSYQYTPANGRNFIPQNDPNPIIESYRPSCTPQAQNFSSDSLKSHNMDFVQSRGPSVLVKDANFSNYSPPAPIIQFGSYPSAPLVTQTEIRGGVTPNRSISPGEGYSYPAITPPRGIPISSVLNPGPPPQSMEINELTDKIRAKIFNAKLKLIKDFPYFRGEATENVAEWIDKWRHLIGTDGVINDQLKLLAFKLEGRASSWFYSLRPKQIPATVDGFFDLMKNKFLSKHTKATNYNKLHQMALEGPGKRSLDEFFHDFRAIYIVSDMFGHDTMAMDLFVRAYQDVNLQRQFNTLRATVDIETFDDMFDKLQTLQGGLPQTTTMGSINEISCDDLLKRLKTLEAKLDTDSRRFSKNPRNYPSGKCWNCKNEGHYRNECPHPRQFDNTERPNRNYNYDRSREGSVDHTHAPNSRDYRQTNTRDERFDRSHNYDRENYVRNRDTRITPAAATGSNTTPIRNFRHVQINEASFDDKSADTSCCAVDLDLNQEVIESASDSDSMPDLVDSDDEREDSPGSIRVSDSDLEYPMGECDDDLYTCHRSNDGPTIDTTSSYMRYEFPPLEICGLNGNTGFKPAVVLGQIGISEVEILVDTGAVVSLVSYETLVRTKSLKPLKPWKNGSLHTASGQSLQLMGTIDLEITIGNARINCEPLVCRNLSREVILGKDILKVVGATINLGNDTVTFEGCDPIPFLDINAVTVSPVEAPFDFVAYAHKEISILPWTEQLIELDVSPEVKASKGVGVLSRYKGEGGCEVFVGNAIIDFEEDTIFGAVANLSDRTILIRPGDPIGEVALLEINSVDNSEAHKSEFKVTDIKLSNELSSHEISQVHALLLEYADIFSESLDQPGQLRVEPFKIDLVPGATPTISKNYRRSEAEHKAIKEMMDDKLKKRIAEPSTGSFAAPIIMVPKKTGGMRMCVDLRKLNQITVTQTFPMPRPDDLFTTVRGSVWLSLADATNGYWQIPMDPSSREKGAYMTREGLFQPTTMDFGMKNAPIVWQKNMHLIFDGLLYERCVIYIDDLLIFSKTFEAHLENMRLCFSRCRNFNLKLRPTKCEFFRRKVNFLGHLISGEGIEVNHAKVAKIKEISVPDSAAKLNSFVCLVAYYREFIRNFADEARVLRDLITADTFEWNDTHQAAFERLKDLLLNSVMLNHPDPSKPFHLECDASDYGVSYILAQEGGDAKIRVISFGSRALNARERNLSTTEKECLAILEGVKKYHIYLNGNEFIVKTDHKALLWLMNHKDHTSKLMRWAMKLQEYRFKIVHRAGKLNDNADALSRLEPETPRAKSVGIVGAVEKDTLQPPPFSTQTFIDAQTQDPVISSYLQYKRLGHLPADRKKALEIIGQCQSLEIIDEILYHIRDSNNRLEFKVQIVIPESLKSLVFSECHDSNLTGGHLGFTKTHLKIRDRYWWPNLYSETRKYVMTCLECQKRKGAQPINAGILTANIAFNPWEHVGVDILGPLPKTDRGNRYIITFTDAVTKYVIGKAIPDATEATTARILVDEVICKYGVMEKLTSDRGSNFTSKMITELYKALGTKKINTTAWHPQGNGQTERFNRPTADMLGIYTNGHQKDWDLHVPPILFAYNTASHETTKLTPFLLMYGRDARYPLEIVAGLNTRTPTGGVATLAEETEARLKMALDLARENTQRSQHLMELRAQETRKPTKFRVGDKVWLYVKRKSSDGETAKLKYPWQGPFEIIQIVSPNVVSLRKKKGIRLGQNVHVSRLKPFFERRPEAVPTLDATDAFDHDDEAVLNSETLKEGENPPPEEVGVAGILRHRLFRGTIEFQIEWLDTDRTWEPEENLVDCEALDKYYRSRPRQPFFGLQLQLEKFQVIFNAKYSELTAKNQLKAIFKEFSEDDQARNNIFVQIEMLTGMTEIRRFVDDFLRHFAIRISRLAPTYRSEWPNSRKRSRAIAEIDDICVIDVMTEFSGQENIRRRRKINYQDKRIEGINVLPAATLRQIEGRIREIHGADTPMIIMLDTTICTGCTREFIRDDYVTSAFLVGARLCVVCCHDSGWRHRLSRIAYILAKTSRKLKHLRFTVKLARMGAKMDELRTYIGHCQLSLDEINDIDEKFLLHDHRFCECCGSELTMDTDICYRKVDHLDRCISARVCATCAFGLMKTATKIDLPLYDALTNECVNDWVNLGLNPYIHPVTPSLAILRQLRWADDRVFSSNLLIHNQQIRAAADLERPTSIPPMYRTFRGPRTDDGPRFNPYYGGRFDGEEIMCTDSMMRLIRVTRKCWGCDANYTFLHDEWEEWERIMGYEYCQKCIWSILWDARALDAVQLCFKSARNQFLLMRLFHAVGKLNILLLRVAETDARLARVMNYRFNFPEAPAPYSMDEEGRVTGIFDECNGCGSLVEVRDVAKVELTPWGGRLAKIGNEQFNEEITFSGMCASCMNICHHLAEEIQLPMYDTETYALIQATDKWSEWYLSLIWSFWKRQQDNFSDEVRKIRGV